MQHLHFLWAHIGVGTLAAALYWASLSSTKGSPRHRLAGRICLLALLATVVTVPPVVVLRPVPFDPAWVVSLVYLSVCVGTVVTLAWTAIRWKQQPQRFRGLHFRVLGPLLLALGAVVLAAGTVKGDPVAAVLSWVGLAFGSAMLVFAWSRRPLHARWWLSWHLNAVLALFTAVHGTLGYVLWRAWVDPQAGRGDAALWHAGVLVLALVMRAVLTHRRGIPWGFFEATPAPDPSPTAASKPAAPITASTGH
jgi:hypothetical protein